MVGKNKASSGYNRGPRLGLVCITAGPAVRFRTLTRARLLQMADPQQREVLRELYESNLTRLHDALHYCDQNNIRLYRMLSGAFPLCDEPQGAKVLDSMADRLATLGKLAEKLDIRVVSHPDQFVVLSSDSPVVISTSVHILTRHALVFDMLHLPRSSWSTIMIHGGKAGRKDTLTQTIDRLPLAVRSRLALENDERAYSSEEILGICRQMSLPMIFDAHHHVIKQALASFEDPSIEHFVRASRGTWQRPSWQIVHLSNGASGINDKRHSQLISVYPTAFNNVPYVEVEAKGKELAIQQLRNIWPEAR